jgi:hypothetical protein
MVYRFVGDYHEPLSIEPRLINWGQEDGMLQHAARIVGQLLQKRSHAPATSEWFQITVPMNPRQTTKPDKSKLVQVAVITTEVGAQAEQTLQRAGIKCIIEAGSGDAAAFSGVWVSGSVRPRAISLLQADPVVQESMPFVFP